MTTSRASGRFLLIDALRGLAALAVVLYHVEEGRHIEGLAVTMPRFLQILLQHGGLGVEVFFVLSGFVIAHAMSRHDVTPGYVGRFMLRRSVRLDPPYWASMALAVAFGVLSTHFVTGKSYPLPGVKQILVHVLYLQDLLGVPPLSSIYWTLCLEIQFYLVFSLLMLVAARLRRRLSLEAAFYAVMLPAAIVADLWPSQARPFGVPGTFLSHWNLFIAGVLVWWSATRPTDRLARAIAITNLTALLILATARNDVALLVGLCAATLILVAALRDKLTTWLSARPLQWLGGISYSLYLTHNAITGATFRVAYRLIGHTLATEVLCSVLVVAVSLAFAYLFHRAIERPSLALSHRVGG